MTTETSIPILDLNAFSSPVKRVGFVSGLRHAFETFGFVGITNHGVSAPTIERAYQASKAFFALPMDVKARYVVPGTGGARGYTEFGVEHAKDSPAPDMKEFWHVGREVVPDQFKADYAPNVWPKESEVPGFRAAMLDMYDDLEYLGGRVLEATALGLGLEQSYFWPAIGHGDSILRPLHYPPIKSSHLEAFEATGSIRSGQHEDINVITLLVGSGEPGLEIQTRAGLWVPVSTVPDTIIVNVGDMLQRSSNNVLRSTTHRVVNPPAPYREQPRYSIPFFLHYNAEYRLEPFAPCIAEQGGVNHYPETMTARAYLLQRLAEIGLL